MRRGRSLGRGSLRLRRRGKGAGVFVAEWRDALGRRVRRALSTDRRVAERMLAEIIRQRDLAIAGLGIEQGQDLEVGDLVEEYLADLATRATAAHVASSRTRLEKVLRGICARRVREIDVDRVLAWRAAQQRGGLSNRTINLATGSLKGLCNWAVRSRKLLLSPLSALRALPQGQAQQRHVRRALSEEEIESFLAAAAEDDRKEAERVAARTTIEHGTKGVGYANRPRRMRVPQLPLWLAFLETGARWSELTRTVWQDLSEKKATLRLRAETTKAGKERLIPLRESLLAVLVELRQVHDRVCGVKVPGRDPIFLTPEGARWPKVTRNAMRILERLLLAAGIEKVDATDRVVDIHSLRHTFASRLARAGVGLVQAQKLLGHSDPKITAQVYTHLEVEDLVQAIEMLPGGARRASA